MKWIIGQLFLYLFYYPLILVAKTLLFWVPAVWERLIFEKKNGKELSSQSFSEITGVSADLAFEFSSEGEYQQVAGLIEDSLKAGKRVELIFFSPSLEKTMIDLARMHSTQVRILRYPFLSFGFNSWITAPVLCMVRYDFFPEFLVWSLAKNKKLRLIWMTFKKERSLGRSVSLMKKLFLKRSDLSFFATPIDQEQAASMGIKGKVFDFRMETISRRILNRFDKFNRVFSIYSQFQPIFDSYPRNKRLILGNAWPNDLVLLNNVAEDVLIVVVPHQLNSDIIKSMKDQLQKLGRNVIEVNESTSSLLIGNTYLLNKKGILCELYSDFGFAYVGGGFGSSIHSVLEPFVAGSNLISCGPKTFRSTEFDLVNSFSHVMVVENSYEFVKWLSTPLSVIDTQAVINREIALYHDLSKDLLSC